MCHSIGGSVVSLRLCSIVLTRATRHEFDKLDDNLSVRLPPTKTFSPYLTLIDTSLVTSHTFKNFLDQPNWLVCFRYLYSQLNGRDNL
ncbi:hypothetical protein CPB84DRAFT_284475 [Gymnopilus junonius]|uniref:Uncharacterized protein n=1 Tax=Gymnopilus junonius TaxID=109634 RepID=A0A9P5TH24_GYMJU|nr:hypothetical protein CPB84DRAFT_284475 [Gymnopilus junonius]